MADDDEFKIFVNDGGNDICESIEAFLINHSGDSGEYRTFILKLEKFFDMIFTEGFAVKVGFGEGMDNEFIGFGVPGIVVDAIEYACDGFGLEKVLESAAERWCEDFFGVIWADGGEGGGGFDAGFEPIFVIENALVHEVVDGQECWEFG